MKLHGMTLRLIRISTAGLVTWLLLMTTSPEKLPAILLLVPFVGLYVFLYLSILEVMRFLGPDEDENGAIVAVRRPRVLSAVLAGYPVLLLTLQSVVELTWWDVLIATIMLLLVYVYIARGTFALRRK